MGWEHVWDVLNEGFADLARGLAADHPGVQWSVGHHDNETILLSGYLSFTYDPVMGDDDLVASVGVYRRDDHLHWTSDLILDTGQVLADGPSSDIPLTADLDAWTHTMLRESLAFLAQHRPLLDGEIAKMKVRQLGPQPVPDPAPAEGAYDDPLGGRHRGVGADGSGTTRR